MLSARASSRGGKTRRSEGYITSACDSPSLGRWVGLGLLAGGRSRLGEVVAADDIDGRVQVRIVDPCFYDPKGERLRG